MKEKLQPPIVIHAKEGLSLQTQVEKALLDGHKKIILEGIFYPVTKEQFSLLTIDPGQEIEIIGKKDTVLDGKGRVSHLLFVSENSSVKVTGVNFINGNTKNVKAITSRINCPQEPLNIFRYVDGGAITIGEGAVVKINRCMFTKNNSEICGGAISNLGGHLNISYCDFEGNTCGDTGSAIDNLSSGSLAVINNCRFTNNQANLAGNGNYGSITAFPNTFLFIQGCDFTGENATAIDWDSSTHVHEKDNLFNQNVNHPIVVNPTHSNGVSKKILKMYAKVLTSKFRLLKKFERVPSASVQTYVKHHSIFNKLINQ